MGAKVTIQKKLAGIESDRNKLQVTVGADPKA